MSANVTETTTLQLSPERVFDHVVDFANLSGWDPTFDRSVRLDQAPIGVGSRFEVVADIAGKQIEIIYEITDYDRPGYARLVGEADNFTSIDIITVEADGDAARLTWDATVDADATLVDTLATPLFKLVAKAAIAGLHDDLDA